MTHILAVLLCASVLIIVLTSMFGKGIALMKMFRLYLMP